MSTTSDAPPIRPHSPSSALASTQHHRRVDLQSPLDLSYLLNNARLAARAKIDLHLPLQTALQTQGRDLRQDAAASSSLVHGDEMRKAVERGVDKYIEDVFAMVRLGVNINGIEGERVDWGETGLAGPEEFEPYDHDLAKRITSMHTAIEGLNLQLAATRREAVARAARQFEESFSIENGEIDETLARYTEIARRAGEATGEEDRLSTGFEGREADVQRIWENAAEGLKRLQPELEATKGRAEGALKVVDYLEGR